MMFNHVYIYTNSGLNMTDYIAHKDLEGLVESVFNAEHNQLSDGGLSILKYGHYTHSLGVF